MCCRRPRRRRFEYDEIGSDDASATSINDVNGGMVAGDDVEKEFTESQESRGLLDSVNSEVSQRSASVSANVISPEVCREITNST